MTTDDGKVHLAPEALLAQTAKLEADFEKERRDRRRLKLITKRAITTHNSWTHNLEEFVSGDKNSNYLYMHPDDADVRGLSHDDPVRIFNDLGEVHCPLAITTDIRPGTVSMAKGLWRKSTYNGSTTNALVPDSLTDLGAGACFNDARVQVALLGRH